MQRRELTASESACRAHDPRAIEGVIAVWDRSRIVGLHPSLASFALIWWIVRLSLGNMPNGLKQNDT
jgi:hypothetical protein